MPFIKKKGNYETFFKKLWLLTEEHEERARAERPLNHGEEVEKLILNCDVTVQLELGSVFLCERYFVSGGRGHMPQHLWRSEDSFQGSVLCFYLTELGFLASAAEL